MPGPRDDTDCLIDEAEVVSWGLCSRVAGHPKDGVSEPVLQRAFEYWRNIDKQLGDRIEQAVRNG